MRMSKPGTGTRLAGRALPALVLAGCLALPAAAQTVQRMQYDDGAAYEGTFRNGVQHGHGSYTMPSGFRYEGEWIDGRIQGMGKATYPDGSIYEGHFTAGRPDGQGRINYAAGGSYEGAWKDGAITGQGVARYADGSVYEGGFTDAAHDGKGLLTPPRAIAMTATGAAASRRARPASPSPTAWSMRAA